MLSEGILPSGHPVTATLLNPQSQVVQTLTNNSGSNGMYAFKFKTDPSSPTGNWQVEVSAGGQTYSKIIKIETIKPNKLLIDLSFGSESVIRSSDISGKMKVNWLTGGAGRDLESRVEVTLSRTNTSFANYKNYIFEDISRNFHSETREIAVGKTDESGKYTFISSIANSGAVPGFLKGVFTTRVFESGGDFSIDNFSTIISPYNTYIGIDVPEQENDWGGKYLNIENEHSINIVALNPYGSPSSIRNVEVEIYKMGWNWWWGSSSGELASYSRDSYNRPYKVFSTSLKDGAGSFALNLSDQEGGFYFIRVMDPIGGHAASKVVLISNSYSLEGTGEGEGAARLKTSIDKDKYNVGETANLSIPSAPGAIAIVSLEKGEKVIKTFNRECKGSTTVISIPIDGTMAPNIYASVTLIQPHNVSSNDAPIRLFGVQKICVEDPKSHLYPEIIVKDEIRPESEVTISVKERDGRAMSYVLEVVDEGLLSLTRFKTPQPWDVFYATEALGVRTWDLYDMVIGAYGAKMERLFAIGGDGEEAVVPSKSKAERFKPVSIFLGPFTLKENGSDVHKITIPQYIGSLRVMVVSTDGKAQGSAQKNVTVKKPLMVQTTMPRVVRVNEKISVPVTVFAMAENMGEVTVKIDVNEAFKVAGADSKTIVMNKSGEEIVYFDVEAASDQQLGEIIASAKCGSEGAKEKIEIDITEPNSPATVSKTILLKGGESSKIDFALAGKKGTNTMQVEASVLPPIDLDYRLKYVISYPYGCLEQTVSAAFPQLYLSDLADLSSQESLESENNIKNALSRLHIFAHPSGGFTYWPGDGAGVSFWSTVYAAHFMIEASGKGYAVPSQLLGKALEYIRERGGRNDDSTLERAYSFYVLALSGNAPRGAMNRLREVSGLSNSDKWFLAAAYAADNKKDMSKDIVSEMVSSGSPKTVNRFALSFDSKERELATAIMVYNALGEYENAFKVVRTLSLFLNDREHYMSTQSTAWALNAIAGYSKTQRGGKIDITLTSSGKHFDIKGDDSYIRKELFNSAESSLSGAIPIEVKNNSSSETSIVISSRGVPSQGEELSSSHGLKVNLKYSTISGGYLDPYNIALGTDFLIETTVTNTSNSIDYTNLMLSQIFPSGWEYKRERTDSYYQDLRDDRIYTSFDLPKYTSITFKVRATATFRGHFYLPATTCEAMYDSSVNGSTSGGWIDIK
jgi:alpha-2-macroglobulin